MALLVVLCLPVLVVAVVWWAWRFHMHALWVLGPSLAVAAGVPGMISGAELDLVLVDGDSVLVGLHSHAADSQMVLSLAGRGNEPLARLQRWQVSHAQLLVWRDEREGDVEMVQLHTGQRVRLHDISRRAEDVRACAARHPSAERSRPGGSAAR
jgi:hypothetical protein